MNLQSVNMKSFIRSSLLTIILSYTFFFSEWLFFTTKPSFLTSLPALEAVSVLFVAVIPVAIVAVAALVIIWALSLIVRHARLEKFSLYIIYIVPSLLSTATIFLLIENFTYTLFEFNIGSFAWLGRYIYGVGLIAFLQLILEYFVQSDITLTINKSVRLHASTAVILTGLSIVFIFLNILVPSETKQRSLSSIEASKPNILIISTDA